MKIRRPGLREEAGQGMIELLIGMVLLFIAVAALLAVLTASAITLQRSAHKGTALSLANQQLELYRRITYNNIMLDSTTIPAKVGASCPYTGSDVYIKANCFDASIPAAANLVTGTCSGPLPAECQATRVVSAASSPDHYDYRVDTYITLFTPTNGRQEKQVFVVVRDNRLVGKPILARNATTVDSSGAATS